MYSVVMLEDFYPYESDFRLQEKQNRLWVPASFTKRAMKSNANNREGKGNKYFGRNLHSFWMLSISDDTHLQCKGGGDSE